MAFSWKIRKSQGICQAPQGILENTKNLGEFSGNFGYGRFKCCFWEMLHSFSHVSPSVSKPPSCMEAYIYFQYTKALNFLSDSLWCTLYSRISNTVWKYVSAPCLPSLQLSFTCIIFHKVQIFTFCFFIEVTIWRYKPFCFMNIW